MEDDSAQRIAGEIAGLACLGDKRVLEIGCGTGRISKWLVSQVDSLTAIDPEPGALRAAADTVPGALCCVGSGEHLPFSADCFNLAVFTLSLHHQDSAAAMREAVRVVGPDGAVIVVEPAIGGEIEAVFSAVHDESQAKRLALRAVRQSGLRVVREWFFSAEWSFADVHDLYQTVFEYYNAPFDRNRADRIDEFLGTKRSDRPLVLRDFMVIQKLAVA